MYRFHRVSQSTTENFQEAARWAKQVAEYISTNYAPITVQAYVELFGDLNVIHWYGDFEDLASFERMNAGLQKDQKYGALLSKASDLFIIGSGHDSLVQSI